MGLKISLLTQDRLIFLVYMILIAAPYVVGISVPMTVSTGTEQFYQYLHDVPENGIVLWATNFGFQQDPDVGGGEIVIYKMLFELAVDRNVKLVFVQAGYIEGATIAENIINDHIIPGGYAKGLVYGEDYVHLGYIPGGEPTMRLIATDLHEIIKSDWYGTPIEDIPMMKDLDNFDDFDLIGCGAASADAIGRQWTGFDTPFIINVQAINIAQVVPLLQKGLVSAFLEGQRGGAQLEYISGYFGMATSAMAGQFFAHLLAIFLIIAPNVIYLFKKFTGGSD